MRRGDAKPRRAARLTTTANDPWSARARPARVPREAQYPKPSESEAFARRSDFAPAAENEAAEGEAEPESPDCETAHGERLAPGGEPLPAPQGLTLVLRERFAATLFADRAARSQTEIEVVENLGGFFRHAIESIACPGRAYTRSPPLRPAFRRGRRRSRRTPPRACTWSGSTRSGRGGISPGASAQSGLPRPSSRCGLRRPRRSRSSSSTTT